jgi:lipopolysaccharide heptosyltransferase II
MKASRMKFIDIYAGLPLCAILFALHKTVSVFRRKPSSREIKNMLFIKFWGMGTIILASPSVKAIRAKYPDARATFMTFTRNEAVCRLLGLADDYVTVDVKRGFVRFIVDTAAAIVRLRAKGIDMAVDLEFFTRFSAIVGYLSGARSRVGFKSWEAWRGDLLTASAPFNRYWHVWKNFGSLAVAAGADFDPSALPRIADGELAPSVKSFDVKFNRLAAGGEDIVCVNPNSAVEFDWPRRWPDANYAELAVALADKYRCRVVIIGGADDVACAEAIERAAARGDRVVNLAGKTSVGDLAALLKKSRLLVTNDSGPMHLAAALGTTVAAFFGASTPALTRPLGEGHLVFFKNLECSPCINLVTNDKIRCYHRAPKCLDGITVGEVLGAIEASGVLRRRSAVVL